MTLTQCVIIASLSQLAIIILPLSHHTVLKISSNEGQHNGIMINSTAQQFNGTRWYNPSLSKVATGEFHIDNITSSFLPPPNITGTFHIGHTFNQSLTDTFLRFQLANTNPRRIVWVSGLDHAGIAAQIVVRESLGRRKVIARGGSNCLSENIWEWYYLLRGLAKHQSGYFKVSINWTKAYFTFSTKASDCLREAFSELDVGCLVYRTRRLVNWDSVLNSVISDLEVDHQNAARLVWYLKSRVCPMDHPLIVGTTKPEELLASDAIVVSPVSLHRKILGSKRAMLPVTNRVVPLVRHPGLIGVVGSEVTAIDPETSGLRKLTNVGHRVPKRVTVAQKRYDTQPATGLLLLELKFKGILLHSHNSKINVLLNSRTATPVSLALARQWFLSLKDSTNNSRGYSGLSLSLVAAEAIRTRKVRFLPSHWLYHNCQWLKGIEDWCLSRQLTWGHEIPSQLLKSSGDVLDTWLSSALIPLIGTQQLNQHSDPRVIFPFTVLFTGYDISFFWVMRMLMVNIYCTELVPFSTVCFHGLFCDVAGVKMSKSKGNVIDPFNFLSQLQKIRTSKLRAGNIDFDVLRVTLLSMASLSRSVVFDCSKLKGSRSSYLKVVNISVFLFSKLERLKVFPLKINNWMIHFATSTLGKWLTSGMQRVVTQAKKHLMRYRLDRLLECAREFMRKKCCDRFIEHIKLSNNIKSYTAKYSDLCVLSSIFNDILLLLHPIAPTITTILYNKNTNRFSQLGVTLSSSWVRSQLSIVHSLINTNNERATEEVCAVVRELRELTPHWEYLTAIALTTTDHNLLSCTASTSQVSTVFTFKLQVELVVFSRQSYKPLAGSSGVLFLLRPNQSQLNNGRQMLTTLISKLLNISFVCHSRLVDVQTTTRKLSFLLRYKP